MKLSAVVQRYVAFRLALGLRFKGERYKLKAFCRYTGDADIRRVRPEQVAAFLAGSGPVTSNWHSKCATLNGFYRFAVGRGYAMRSPMPALRPKIPPPMPPYIYTTGELRRLLAATPSLSGPKTPRRGELYRVLLLVLYGGALRISEALRLTLADVDLQERVLAIRDSKFFKSRLVPIGPRLTAILTRHIQGLDRQDQDLSLFPTLIGTPMGRSTAERLFAELREAVGVRRDAADYFQPRLHDLRHTSAVHRLISWYRQGADVQRLLPKLSVYLGHSHLSDTQRYLKMTPELLKQASRRFERYALLEVNHA